MIRSRDIVRLASLALGCAALFVVGSRAGAQAAAATQHWQPWIGCWQPVDAQRVAPMVCVVPTAEPSSVEIVTIDSSKVGSRYTVDASAQQRAVDRDGCGGWEKAQWSQDGRRVFLRAALTCTGDVTRTSSGIMSMTAGGEWVDVQTVIAGGNEVVRTVRYRSVGTASGVPADIASRVAGTNRLDARTATLAAGAQVTAAAVAEASRLVDTSSVQAWLVERGQPFQVDARELVALADQGVPGSVTDVMVALSYPDEFRFNRGSVEGPEDRTLTAADSARIANDYAMRRGMGCDSYGVYSPFGWGGDPCFGYGYGYGYGLSRYGYNRYGYSPYGYGPSYYGFYTRPVVIVRGSEAEHGRAVKGKGYTRDRGDGSTSTGTAARSGGSTTRSGGASSAGESKPASSGKATSGTVRTAHPRPPK